MDNLTATFTRDDYFIMELGSRVIWCLFVENTGSKQVRLMVFQSRAKGKL